jgi:hypothetical protein
MTGRERAARTRTSTALRRLVRSGSDAPSLYGRRGGMSVPAFCRPLPPRVTGRERAARTRLQRQPINERAPCVRHGLRGLPARSAATRHRFYGRKRGRAFFSTPIFCYFVPRSRQAGLRETACARQRTGGLSAAQPRSSFARRYEGRRNRHRREQDGAQYRVLRH